MTLITEIIMLVLASIALSLDFLKLYQLNGYYVSFSKNFYVSIIKLVVISLIAVIVEIVIHFVFLKLNLNYGKNVSFVVVFIMSQFGIFIGKIKGRQKLVYTNRIKRILCVEAIILGIYLSFCSAHFSYARSLCFALIPLFVLGANYLLYPIEYLIKNHYINCSKKILSSKKMIVIGITGSYGKTSVKEILYSILSEKYEVLKTPKNYNTPMGICLTLKDLDNQEIFIVEMGARNVGDIKKICKMVKPNIGIVTGITKQHLKTFKTIENIYHTKRELQKNLVSNGPMFYNDNNVYCNQMKYEFNGEKFGIKDIKHKSNSSCLREQTVDAIIDGKHFLFVTSLFGEHNVENILLASRCAMYLGMSFDEISSGIHKIKEISNRFDVKTNGYGVTIIDDSYNSNIEGVKAALEYLKCYRGRKIVFSQGLVELGSEQFTINKALGSQIAKIAEIVILLGVNSKAIESGLFEGGFQQQNVYKINRFSEAELLFSKILVKGDVVLIQNDLTDNY